MLCRNQIGDPVDAAVNVDVTLRSILVAHFHVHAGRAGDELTVFIVVLAARIVSRRTEGPGTVSRNSHAIECEKGIVSRHKHASE